MHGHQNTKYKFSLFMQRLWFGVVSPRVVVHFNYQCFEGICCLFYPKDEDNMSFWSADAYIQTAGRHFRK
jgi:hypothetical protein